MARLRYSRWRARVLDLDIVLWSAGPWASERLVIPHGEFRRRAFVLGPAAAIGIGEKTVKVHRARAMTKMHADSVASLVRMVDALDEQVSTVAPTDEHQRAG